ncbi:MAG: tyrosine-type recombinase/integrase, partial [Pseudomonadales bacterium]|nr:tyrosine-type recombinase/integrase [Pseudomonadales bacterium]
DTKNKEPHRLPMSTFLYDLLKRRSDAKECAWVFPSPMTDSHLQEPKTAVAKVAELANVPFTLHDLRRTFITIAESLDIPGYALKRLLNHKDPNDVTAGYIISDVERLREPMQRITDFIVAKIQG